MLATAFVSQAAVWQPGPSRAAAPPVWLSKRNGMVAAGVICIHALGLAWLGLYASTVASPPRPHVVQAQLITPMAQPEAPASPPTRVPQNKPKLSPIPQQTVQRPAPLEPTPAPPAPHPIAAPAAIDPQPAISEPAPTVSAVAANEANPHHEATPSVSARPSAPPAPPRIELPSANAAYLNNPPPAYPALSRRLGEQGRVVLRVRIEPDGTASAAEIRSSSGYERLDRAALDAVLRWRYVPGKRNGVPEAMWFLIPVQFVLE